MRICQPTGAFDRTAPDSELIGPALSRGVVQLASRDRGHHRDEQFLAPRTDVLNAARKADGGWSQSPLPMLHHQAVPQSAAALQITSDYNSRPLCRVLVCPPAGCDKDQQRGWVSWSSQRVFVGLLSILWGTGHLVDKRAKLGSLLLKLIEPRFQDVTNTDHANAAFFLFHWKVPNVA